MDIDTFVARSLGRWKSQRSAHHLAFAHFEEIRSIIDIEAIAKDDPAVIALCEKYGFQTDGSSEPLHQKIATPFKMSWEGETDWNEDDVLKGQTILVPVPDPEAAENSQGNLSSGQLLRDQGYAETIPAAGRYIIQADGTFVLTTGYDRAAAEEKIWFATENLRFRVSLIKTSNGKGVTTASLSSEVRISSQQ
ncbi:MAG: phycobiliprotein lyase [Cyanobacteria bacterium J06554_11]